MTRPNNQSEYGEPIVFAPTYGNLGCPRCGGGWLHQTEVRVFERKEDGIALDVRVQSPGICSVGIGSSADNPSLRRNAVRITFRCEFCGDSPDRRVELVFAQDKGLTELYWIYASRLDFDAS